MDEYLKAQLEAIDAANVCILKHQTAIVTLIGAIKFNDNKLANKALDDFEEATAKYAEKIKEISKELEDGGH